MKTMKFTIAKREVVVEWDHIYLVLAVLIGYAIALWGLTFLFSGLNVAETGKNLGLVTSVDW